jgi:hypothetical protein
MDIKEDTRRYEEWLAKHTALYRPHLKLKHDLMREESFLSSVQLFTGGYRSGRKSVPTWVPHRESCRSVISILKTSAHGETKKAA